MTREEARKVIRKMLACTDLRDRANLKADMIDACHMAIKALEQEPCGNCIKFKRYAKEMGFEFEIKKNPCEDAISRQAVLEITAETGALETQARVKALPPVTQEPKTGRWIKTPKAVMDEGYMWYCDKCGYQVYQDSSRPYPSEKYCPNCGVKMESEVAKHET